MNVYEMYVKNGNKADFFIRRDTWASDTFCLVKKIGGKSSGALTGKSPYFDNPRVVGKFYLRGELSDSKFVVSCPGTYSYSLIAVLLPMVSL